MYLRTVSVRHVCFLSCLSVLMARTFLSALRLPETFALLAESTSFRPLCRLRVREGVDGVRRDWEGHGRFGSDPSLRLVAYQGEAYDV